jgi:hypothetical protein
MRGPSTYNPNFHFDWVAENVRTERLVFDGDEKLPIAKTFDEIISILGLDSKIDIKLRNENVLIVSAEPFNCDYYQLLVITRTTSEESTSSEPAYY